MKRPCSNDISAISLTQDRYIQDPAVCRAINLLWTPAGQMPEYFSFLVILHHRHSTW